MLPYLYLVGSIIGCTSGNVIATMYNRKNACGVNSTPLYQLLQLGAIFLFWTVLFLTDTRVDLTVCLYALLFASCFFLSAFGSVQALKYGSTLLTSLLMQVSVICVAIWGFFFWGSPFTVFVAIGLVLVVLALFLCLYGGKINGNKKISVRWLAYSALMFFCNAGCSIIQKTQQMKFDGQYGNFLMFVATGLAALCGLFVFLRSDKRNAKSILKSSWYYPVSAGILNGVLNLCVIVLATSTLSPSLIYPALAIGSLALTTVFSWLVFKEKMQPWQWLGVVVGAIATALLSL